MSFLNTTAVLRHTTLLPAGTDRAQAIKTILQNHEGLIQCGPHSVDCERVTGDEAAKLTETTLSSQKEHPLPDEVRVVIESPSGNVDGRTFAIFRVTDVVHTLPAGLWDSKVVSTYEMTDMAAGVYVRIRSPLSIVMDTTWSVVNVEGKDDQLELVEEIAISCSRLLMGTVKGLCEGGWHQIHANMIKRLTEGDAAKMDKN